MYYYPLKTLIQSTALIVAWLGVLQTGITNAQASCDNEPVDSVLSIPAMNSFRRFNSDAEPMFRFYTDVLGFEPLTTFGVGNDTDVWRIMAGASELKLTGLEEGRTYIGGDVADATGLRLWTFFFSDESALKARFEGAGLPEPHFRNFRRGSFKRTALVTDPDGQTVELVITGDAPGTTYAEMEVGMVVSDLAESFIFYRDFLGLDHLRSEYDPRFRTTKHVFGYGLTTVSLRSFPHANLPADTGTGGIQYVVSDVDRVGELADCWGVSIDKPVFTIPGFTTRTIWLEDSDGITNYFADTEETRGEV